jgi:hypothetical protein
VNFFRKRIPCQCLDKKYKEVKSIIKMGLCCNPACSLPDRQVERKKMFKCTGGCRCSNTYYCSYECQKADWSEHKKECSRMAEAVAKLKRGSSTLSDCSRGWDNIFFHQSWRGLSYEY